MAVASWRLDGAAAAVPIGRDSRTGHAAAARQYRPRPPAEAPVSDNVYELLQSRFPADPAALAMETPDGGHVTYAQMADLANRYARVLGDLGVARGDRVAAQVDKSPQNVSLYLGCLQLGAIFLPLNTAYTRSEVACFLGDAGPRVFVCRPEAEAALADTAREAGVAHLLTLGADGGGSLAAQAQGCAPLTEIAPVAADEVAVIIYTSGTTGRSKGAMLSHGNLAANALTLHRIWGFRPGDVLLHALPVYHVHGLFVALHCALLNGSPMLFLPRFDIDEVIRLLPRATVMMGVPTFYTRLLARADFTADLCRSMRLFVSGSAPLLEQTFHAFRERTGFTILERYGMTETGMNTSNPLDGERKPGTVGPALPDVSLRIADGEGRPLPRGQVGVIEVRGPNVFTGYWRMPDKTAAEFRSDGFFITGDVAVMDEDGHVTIVGRAKDLIISGGLNVYPSEVESVIDRLDHVIESAVVGVPHSEYGEAVVAVVARREEAPITERDVIDGIKGELAGFKVPKRVFFVEELPRNTMGKVQKNELRQRHGGLFADTFGIAS